jgi:DNA-binding NarL/FixJ family response regulator
MRPLIVAESASAAGTAVAALRRDGWTPVSADGLPAQPWDLTARRLLVTCRVERARECSAALLAAARGAGVVAVSAAGSTELAMFYDELSRLGRVTFAADPTEPTLTPEQRRLLELLAEGETLRGAARRLSLSRRTAHRRLADARAVLGVGSTVEAVLAFRAGEETRRGPGLRRV